MNPVDTPASQALIPMAKYKLIFLGDQSVGKTSVINRFINDAFDGKNHPTVGIDFISKTMHFEDRSVRLQLWDTAGQERFRSLIPNYIRDSQVVVLVYDITNEISFQNIQKWYEDVKEHRGLDCIIVLIANKIDLEEYRKVTSEDGQLKAKQYNIPFFEVSAKSGFKIDQLFKNIALLLPPVEASYVLSATYNFLNQQNLQRQQQQQPLFEKSNGVTLQNPQAKTNTNKSDTCC